MFPADQFLCVRNNLLVTLVLASPFLRLGPLLVELSVANLHPMALYLQPVELLGTQAPPRTSNFSSFSVKTWEVV